MIELKTFQRKALKISPQDDVGVALQDLKAGDEIVLGGQNYVLATNVAAKHKFALKAFATGEKLTMYGTVVGEAVTPIPVGGAITTGNTQHQAAAFERRIHRYEWQEPDNSRWKDRTFQGFHRADGQVGTRNYWLVVPLVFCENRNIERMKEALEEELGYGGAANSYRQRVRELVRGKRNGNDPALAAKDGDGMGHSAPGAGRV